MKGQIKELQNSLEDFVDRNNKLKEENTLFSIRLKAKEKQEQEVTKIKEKAAFIEIEVDRLMIDRRRLDEERREFLAIKDHYDEAIQVKNEDINQLKADNRNLADECERLICMINDLKEKFSCEIDGLNHDYYNKVRTESEEKDLLFRKKVELERISSEKENEMYSLREHLRSLELKLDNERRGKEELLKTNERWQQKASQMSQLYFSEEERQGPNTADSIKHLIHSVYMIGIKLELPEEIKKDIENLTQLRERELESKGIELIKDLLCKLIKAIDNTVKTEIKQIKDLQFEKDAEIKDMEEKLEKLQKLLNSANFKNKELNLSLEFHEKTLQNMEKSMEVDKSKLVAVSGKERQEREKMMNEVNRLNSLFDEMKYKYDVLEKVVNMLPFNKTGKFALQQRFAY